MKEIINIGADVSNLPLINERLEGFLMKHNAFALVMKISLVVEEIFTNIALYAYSPNKGDCEIDLEVVDNKLIITFIDSGKAYNPLLSEEPDITLDAKSRSIGGLGIYLSKTISDSMDYQRIDNKNVLTITKAIN